MNLSKTLGSLGSSAATQSVFKRKDIADLTAVRHVALAQQADSQSAYVYATVVLQIFNYYDTEHSGSVTGSNVKHMLFAVRARVLHCALMPLSG